jgi:hypothetical protein
MSTTGEHLLEDIKGLNGKQAQVSAINEVLAAIDRALQIQVKESDDVEEIPTIYSPVSKQKRRNRICLQCHTPCNRDDRRCRNCGTKTKVSSLQVKLNNFGKFVSHLIFPL